MAIKVNGTTVINDSRALSNIASVDAGTVSAMSAALPAPSIPSGGAVGSYSMGRPANATTYYAGDTASSVYEVSPATNAGYNIWFTGTSWSNGPATGVLSGTWKAMGTAYGDSVNNYGFSGLWVRVS
jgi:hypothetical protein